MPIIEGYVKNADSGLGIPRVEITLSGTSGVFKGVTDNNGYYKIQVPAGFYTLMVREREYEPITEGITVSANVRKDIYIRRITF